MAEDLLSIGEIARRAGIATSALRYYEELGLLRPVTRVSGRRYYESADIGVVGVILLLSDIGFTLREIKELMVEGSQSSISWRELTEKKLRQTDQMMAKLQVGRLFLEHALKCTHEDITQCPKFRSVVAGHLAGIPLEVQGH